MANIKIEERVEQKFGIPFEQWVSERQDERIIRLACDADCSIRHMKEALKRNGFRIVSRIEADKCG